MPTTSKAFDNSDIISIFGTILSKSFFDGIGNIISGSPVEIDIGFSVEIDSSLGTEIPIEA